MTKSTVGLFFFVIVFSCAHNSAAETFDRSCSSLRYDRTAEPVIDLHDITLRWSLEEIANLPRDELSDPQLLYALSVFGRLDAIPIVLANGSNIDARMADGSTAVLVATVSGCLDTVKLLAEHGANLELGTNDGLDPLAQAMYSGNADLVKYLRPLVELREIHRRFAKKFGVSLD